MFRSWRKPKAFALHALMFRKTVASSVSRMLNLHLTTREVLKAVTAHLMMLAHDTNKLEFKGYAVGILRGPWRTRNCHDCQLRHHGLV
jgi:hypothetical protein